MLFKKNLYPLAISIANSQHYDYDSVIEIFTQYGDHLYGKGDYDGAIAQYVRTIGRLEPSYVIRKVCVLNYLFSLAIFFFFCFVVVFLILIKFIIICIFNI